MISAPVAPLTGEPFFDKGRAERLHDQGQMGVEPRSRQRLGSRGGRAAHQRPAVFPLQAIHQHDAPRRLEAMENWDSYSLMAHNYYVYADPGAGGVLKWIPWDLNEAMLDGGPRSTSVLMDEVSADWPLIRYLLDDEVYRQFFKDKLLGTLTGALAVAAVQAKAETYHALVAPYVAKKRARKRFHHLIELSAVFLHYLVGSFNM